MLGTGCGMSLTDTLTRERPAAVDPLKAVMVHLPFSVDAEQALLGCVLYDNAAIERVDETVKEDHFYEPAHARMWAAILRLARKGQVSQPILVYEEMRQDPALEELGGIRYLADLVDRAPPAANAPDYATLISDLWLRRRVMDIAANALQAARDGEHETGRELVESAEAELYALAETKRSEGFQPFDHYMTGALNMAAEALGRDGGVSGVSTGLVDLDHKTGGMHPSDLIIIAARPSMGKTSIALNIALNVARKYAYEPQPDGSRRTIAGGRVGFFSAEMSGEQLALRIVAEVSGVSGDRLRKGDIRVQDFGHVRDAAMEISEIPLHIDATGGLTMGKLAARARRLKRRHGLDLIFIDYLQLLVADKARGGASRVEQITEITVGLKALAKELGVPVIALSQLSRAVEQRDDKRPQLSDLRESGSIEQDADAVWFLYREEYYLERKEPRAETEEHMRWQEQMDQCRGLADCIVGKARHGPIGTVRLAFNSDLTKFTDLARDGHMAARMPYGDDA
jgi:replicative DNA helicase